MDQFSAFVTLRELLKATAAFSGESFLRESSSAIARQLSADFVFITRLVEAPSDTVKMLAAWRDGVEVTGWEFALSDTPCELIYQQDLGEEWNTMRVGSAVGLAENVCNRFASTRQTSYQAFIGVPLWDSHNKMMGHVALFFNRSLDNDDECKRMVEIVELFSLKVQSELNRMLIEQEREHILQELKDANNRLTHESVTDSLTGLYNRRYFTQRIQELHARFKRSAETFTLILLDVDRFKNINDTFGHDAGDTALCYLANALSQNMRSKVELLFRTGGEEFAILLPSSITLDELNIINDRINRTTANIILPKEMAKVQLTVSIGASWPNGDDADWNAIYIRADMAMYVAKKKGGNQAWIN